MKTRTYTLPIPKNLSLEKRMNNAEKLYTSDLRSVEARFKDIGSCTLLKYFKTEGYEDLLYEFLDALPYSSSNPLSPSATYAETAARIHELYENGDVNQAILLIYLFLKPFYRKSVITSIKKTRELLHNPTTRTYTLFVNEYAEVLDTLYPEQRINIYQYSIDMEGKTLLEVLHNSFELYNHDYAEDYTSFDESLVTGANEAKFSILRELFIDPFYFLWTEDQKNKK